MLKRVEFHVCPLQMNNIIESMIFAQCIAKFEKEGCPLYLQHHIFSPFQILRITPI